MLQGIFEGIFGAFSLKALLILIAIIGIAFFLMKKENYTGYFHRSNLASTFWISKPQVQHSLYDLKLQYPSHTKYFSEVCNDKNPNNAELCRYHKHRFDTAQL